MKSLSLLMMVLVLSLFASVAFAGDTVTITSPLANLGDEGVALKQGAMIMWHDTTLKNMTSTTIAETVPGTKWSNLENMLWSGWCVDVAWGYDASAQGIYGLMLGREVGTLGNYLPINFPLKDKIAITVYPIGAKIQQKENSDKRAIQGCSGGSFVKLAIKF